MDEEKDDQNKRQDNQAGSEKTGGTEEGELEKCQKQAEEYLNGWKRARADFENYQKDEAKRLEEFTKFANTGLILELIALADEADIALKQMPEEIRKNHPDWVDGAMEVRKKFDAFLETNGLSKIKTRGENFDPAVHEAVETVPVEEGAGKVVEEVRTGYALYGKVIRPARVKISGEMKNEKQTANGK